MALDSLQDLLSFIQALQQAVAGLPNDAPVADSHAMRQLHGLLDSVEACIDHNPVLKDKDVSRFGKVEFRGFYDDLKAIDFDITKEDGSPVAKEAVSELQYYFQESWGNRTRLDYGSGHELNFALFLYGLGRAGILDPAQYAGVVLRIFNRYMAIMRRLQKAYWLEPAGSHGVWGLDDYHFLPFLFGAAQLTLHAHLKPKLIHNPELVDSLWQKYMYFECIHFINSIKSVPGQDGNRAPVSLRWHSPMLDDISAAKSWSKISEGMVKMYKAEVLSKLPIVQHIRFGTLLVAPADISTLGDAEEDHCGHSHQREALNTWGDCCGIKVPSAIAASQMNQRIPFD